MIAISYLIGCRNCFQSDNIRHRYLIDNAVEKDYINMPEYDAMRLVENWRIEDNHRCDYCNSPNVEVFELMVNEHLLYDYKKLENYCNENSEHMIMIKIIKENSKIDVKIGESENVPNSFIQFVLCDFIRLIIRRPNNYFSSKENGNLFVCMTSKSGIPILESFRSVGFTKTEIYDIMKPYTDEFDISIPEIRQMFESKINLDIELDFIFKSSNHIRYENNIHVSGPHGGARRAIKIEPNINDNEVYTITIYNLDGKHPVWQNNVQMTPKQMKVKQTETNKILLVGYGYDAMGESFSDYGLTIILKEKNIEKCILHMYDRNIDIEYLS